MGMNSIVLVIKAQLMTSGAYLTGRLLPIPRNRYARLQYWDSTIFTDAATTHSRRLLITLIRMPTIRARMTTMNQASRIGTTVFSTSISNNPEP